MPNEIEHLDITIIQPRLRDLASWDEHGMKLRLEQECIRPSLKEDRRHSNSDEIAAEAFQKRILRPLIYAYDAKLWEMAAFESHQQQIQISHEDAKILADTIIDTLARMMAGVNSNDPSNNNNMVQKLIENARQDPSSEELLLPKFGEIIPRIEKKAAEYRAQFERTILNSSKQALDRKIEDDPNTLANAAIQQALPNLNNLTPSNEEEKKIQAGVAGHLTNAEIERNPRAATQHINAVNAQLGAMQPTSFIASFKKILLELSAQLALIFSKTLSLVADKEELEHKGDLIITGNVGNDAQVGVIDGDLTIKGNIGANTQIHMEQSSERAHLTVEGNVGRSVTIKTNQTDVTLKGSVSPDCKIQAENGKVEMTKGVTLGDDTKGGGLRFGKNVTIKGRNVHISSGDVVTDPKKDGEMPTFRK